MKKAVIVSLITGLLTGGLTVELVKRLFFPSAYSKDFSVKLADMKPGAAGWYVLTADAPRSGYVIDGAADATYFVIAGDSACRSNHQEAAPAHGIECYWSTADDFLTKVGAPTESVAAVQFRTVTGAPPPIKAHLHVTYIPRVQAQ